MIVQPVVEPMDSFTALVIFTVYHNPGPVWDNGCLVTGSGRGWPLVVVVTVTFITRMEIMAKVKHFIIVNPMFQWLGIVSFS